jgi:formylglycine-generating enzyme required for sulfatase activity
MEPSLRDLITRLDVLSDGASELREGVRKAVLVADLDPEMALTRARKVLEYVVREVFERRINEPPGTRPLENLLQRLLKDGFFPERLDAYANFVRKLGNVGTHHFGEGISAGDVYQSLAQLMPILEWYFEVERPDLGVRLGSSPAPERTSRASAVPLPPSSTPNLTPAPAVTATGSWAALPIGVVPKGLRSFDATDSNFFLALLPGPRDQDGLPDSLRFWKYRIEESREPSFAVGVIYGPSGCGKSSLVKAGLLPRLAPEIRSVYVEATPDETEARLLSGLTKRLPGLSHDLDLVQAMTALRQGQGLSGGPRQRPRVVLVIDQFEQWLHAHRGEAGSELARALRQCDGERLRAVLMVRDDFWMGLTRFLDDVGVELLQGQNATAVDLFDLIHARKVLTAFGQAFGRLPESAGGLTAEHRAFLDQATRWLAQDGRVISIRLALFAEMVKGKPWTPDTLAEAGNMQRIGVAFLEETFRAPVLRPNEKPAQAILKALLPEHGTDIKGHMRSRQELHAAAGDSIGPEVFDALLKTLDRDVRLITPTDPGGQAGTEVRAAPAQEAQYYQLTHDYLVPSLREWLNRKQRESREGRAELCLAERAALWRERPQNRFLPSAVEWCRIRLLTKRAHWSEPQRRMMHTAARVHGARALGVLAVLALLLGTGLEIRRRVVEGNKKRHAEDLVQELLKADIAEVPDVIVDMKGYRRWVDPELRQRLPGLADSSRAKLHVSLALLPDPGQVEFLFGRLLGAGPAELAVLRDALQPHQGEIIPRLWPVLESARPDDPRVLTAGAALALYEPGGPRWAAIAPKVAGALVSVDPVYLGSWMDVLQHVCGTLTDPLAAIFRDPARSASERTQATHILAEYAGDQPDILADLLMDADEKPFAVMFERLKAHPQRAVALLEAELARKPAPDATIKTHERQAKRQARAAAALLRLGQPEDVWPLLWHNPDPSVRSFLVHWLRPLGTDPKVLVLKLEDLAKAPVREPLAASATRMDAILFDPVTSLRRALILALGEYPEDFPAAMRASLAATLLDAYRNDPDAGVHGAVEWTLRQWNQEEALNTAAAGLPRLEARGDRRWFVNGLGQTLALIGGPVTFTMGSPSSEPGRFDDETLHPQRIDRRFAIAAQEVTREQYERFVHADPRNQKHAISGAATYTPDPQGPQAGVTWYNAAAYCNWLSAREQLEPCYEPNDKAEYAEGMKITADFRRRSGYRLPTEAEWEYACRAGALTSRYYGESLELLVQYAWYQPNSPETKASRCGRKKPNELGLFDALGNVYEWCQDQERAYGQNEGVEGDETITISLLVTDKERRVRRGGGFGYPPAYVRAANRNPNLPPVGSIASGFRLVRTCR